MKPPNERRTACWNGEEHDAPSLWSMQAGPYSYRPSLQALPERDIREIAVEACDARLRSSPCDIARVDTGARAAGNAVRKSAEESLPGRHFDLLHSNRTRVRMLLGTNRSSHDRPIGR